MIFFQLSLSLLSASAEAAEKSVNTWKELKNEIESGSDVTINLNNDLVANKTITINDGKNVTIKGDKKTITRSSNAKFLSMFKVEGGGTLNLENGVTLSGEKSSTSYTLKPMDYSLSASPDYSGKKFVIKAPNDRLMHLNDNSDKVSLVLHENIKFDETQFTDDNLETAIFETSIYGYDSGVTHYYYKFKNEKTKRVLAAVERKNILTPSIYWFNVNGVDEETVKIFEGNKDKENYGTVAMTHYKDGGRGTGKNYDKGWYEGQISFMYPRKTLNNPGTKTCDLKNDPLAKHKWLFANESEDPMVWGESAGTEVAAPSDENKPILYEVTNEKNGNDGTYSLAELGDPKKGGFFIHNDGGTVNINDATLKNFKASNANNNFKNIAPVYNENKAVFNMSSGSITDNEVGYRTDKCKELETIADKPGREINKFMGGNPNNCAGAVIFDGSTGNINGNAIISYNKGDSGAIILKNSSEVSLEGSAQINDNIGVKLAGAVYINGEGSSFTMNSDTAKIGKNISWRNGAVTAVGESGVTGGRFTLNKGEIHENYSYDKGGAIRVSSNGVSLYGGEIHHNKSRVMGGAIYVDGDNPTNSRTLVLNNGSIYNNKAVDLHSSELGGDTDVYFPKNKPDSRPGYLQSGCGGGVWTCPFGTLIFDASAVDIYHNSATREDGGKDFHKDNGLSGALVINKLPKTWINEENKPLPSGDANPIEGQVNLTNNVADDYKGNDKGVKIYNNISRRGGGIGANGTLLFGSKEKIERKQAFLTFTKKWEEETTPESIYLKFTAIASDGHRTDLGIKKLDKENRTLKIALPNTVFSNDKEEPLYSTDLSEGQKILLKDWKIQVEEVNEDGSPSNKFIMTPGDVTLNEIKTVTQTSSMTNSGGKTITTKVEFKTFEFSQTATNEVHEIQQSTPTQVTIKAKKTAKDFNLENYRNKFNFQLLEVVGGEEKVLETVKNSNKEGNEIKFSPIVYKEAGDYSYIVRELPGDDDKIKYDGEDRKVDLTVEQEGRKLVIKDIINNEITVQEFVNKKKPENPKNPEDPEEPGKPDKPEKPEKPDKPDKPDNPDKPEKPDKPNTPDNPDKPNTPPSVKTGDTSGIRMYLSIISLSVLALVFLFRKKHEK